MQIGERIRFYRRRARLTLREVSGATGLSVSFISDVERGATMPSLMTCQKVASLHGITLSLLFSCVEIDVTNDTQGM